MAVVGSIPLPQYGVAFCVPVEIFDSATNLPVTGFTSPDEEVSKDGFRADGTTPGFENCTNDVVYVGHGMGYLNLTATEMTASLVQVSIVCTEGTFNISIVPENGNVRVDTRKLGGTTVTGRDIGASVLLSSGTGTGELDFTAGVVKTNTTQWSGSAVAAVDTSGYPKVTIKNGTGTGEVDLAAGVVKANLIQILATALTETDGVLATAFKKFFDVASPLSTMNVIGEVAMVNDVAGSVTTAISGAVGTRIDSDHGEGSYVRNTEPLDASATNAQVAAALATYDGPTKAEMDTAVAALATPAQVLTQVNTALNTAIAQPTAGTPTATPSLREAAAYQHAALVNNNEDTQTTRSLKNAAGTVLCVAPIESSSAGVSQGKLVAP
jgi:hypothetical protein